MKFALCKNEQALEADTLIEIIILTGLFRLMIPKGVLYFREERDSITYSSNYTPKEMVREMASRGIKLLEREGWTLYKS